MIYLLESVGSKQAARSLAHAKALAPLMFQLQGTKHMWVPVTISRLGEPYATYGRTGWNVIMRNKEAA